MENEKLNNTAAPTEQEALLAAETYINVPTRPSRGTVLTPDDWVWLNPNDRVKVQREKEPVTAGAIDVVALDASIFWIWLDGGRGRVALHMDDNVSVWLEEEQD